MKNIKAVIGASLGDESKGKMTDYFCSQFTGDGLVIRYNSGAQAGHTVTFKDGTRHVFGHIGSGTYRNVPTYLSKFFVCNPILFFKELVNFKMMPVIYVDPESLITTPYDMLVNQILETMRGSKRHGSCGVGFNETIVRSLQPRYKLQYSELTDIDAVKKKLHLIRGEYLSIRFNDLGIDISANKAPFEIIMNNVILDKFIADCKSFQLLTHQRDVQIINDYQNVVFEGAQGLLLDQNNMEWFPHLTRSNIGLQNIIVLMEESGNDCLEAVYVTRCYTTRHGAGPLPRELPEKPYAGIEDKTNINNTWQGGLRFAYLDLNLLEKTISKDVRLAQDTSVRVNKSLAVSCLDQVGDGELKYYSNNELIQDEHTCMLYSLNKLIEPYVLYTSWGSTAEHIEQEKGNK